MATKKANISQVEVLDLAKHILGITDDELDDELDDEEYVEYKLQSKWLVSLDDFHEIISRLIPLIDYGESPLTGTIYKGFADVEEKRWLCRMKVED